MATHSSVFAWRIPGTGEPGGLPSMGSHRVRSYWSDLAAASLRPKWVSYKQHIAGFCLVFFFLTYSATQYLLIEQFHLSESVQFSCSVMSLRAHEPQHASNPYPSPTPESTQTHVHWVSDAIQPSLSSPSPLALNLSQHQGFFQMSQLYASGGQSIGVSALTSVLPMNTQDWSPLG